LKLKYVDGVNVDEREKKWDTGLRPGVGWGNWKTRGKASGRGGAVGVNETKKKTLKGLNWSRRGVSRLLKKGDV